LEFVYPLKWGKCIQRKIPSFYEFRLVNCSESRKMATNDTLNTIKVKKFQALEEFQAQQESVKLELSGGNDEENFSKKKKKVEDEKLMSEEELQEIFRRTSAFTAASVVLPPDPNQITIIEGEYDSEPEYYVFDDGWDMTGIVQGEDADGQAFFDIGDDSDFSDDDDDIWGRIDRKVARSKKRRAARHAERKLRQRVPKPKKAPSESGRSTPNMLLSRERASLLKRVRRRKAVNPNAIAFVKIPNEPIPSSWAKRITQFVPADATHVHTIWASQNVLMPRPVSYSAKPAAPFTSLHHTLNLESLKSPLLELAKASGGFHAVVLNPPWKEPRPGAALVPDGIVPEDLMKLPLADHSFLSAGFVYIWTPKHWLHRTLQALEQMDLHYVENAVVVNESVGDGPPFSQPCTYFSQQKETLLVCRRGVKHPVSGKMTWEPIELRHQRISDVHLACYRPSNTREDIPLKPTQYVHKMTETMLPTSRFNSDLPEAKPRFCEIWANGKSSRAGWVFVSMDSL
jgi:hypothetical protein